MDAHRKIDLQAPQDLTYIEANIRRVAQAKVDAHMSAAGTRKASDAAAQRANIDALVEKYVTDTLTLALPSISINGHDAPAELGASDAEPQDAAFEPYDVRLAERLRSLYAELESETTKVAQLRREAPAKASAVYLQKLRQDMAAEDQAFEAARKSVAAGGEGAKGVDAKNLKLERRDRVKAAYEAASAEVESLRNVTETLATLERADRAWKEVSDA